MSRVGIGIRPPKKRALGIVDVNVLIIHHLGWQASDMFWGHLSEMLYRASEATTFVNTCRLLVTYLDRDMEFVWNLKHLDKTSCQRSSSVQIKPPQLKPFRPNKCRIPRND